MNIDLKLKDCTLVQIGSELGTRLIFDYYDDYWVPNETISFTFDDGTCVDFYEIDADQGCFTYIVSFFYKKDFSEYKKDQFISEFSEYVNVKPKVRGGDS